MSEIPIRALCQTILSNTTSVEDNALLDAVCRRLILAGLTVSATGKLELSNLVGVQVVNAGIVSIVNVGDVIAGNFLNVSLTVPAVVGQATGYYGGLFFNITDKGSAALNKDLIGLVAQSAYSNAAYFQQGEVLGTLARSNVLAGVYITRVIASLGAFQFTKPILQVEETTAATGGLFELLGAGSVRKVFVDSTGAVTIATTLGVTGVTTLSGVLAVNASLTMGAAQLFFWSTRAILDSPADGHLRVSNNAQTAGVTLDVATLNGTVTVKNNADNANGHLSAASVRGAAVAFASVPSAPVEGMLCGVTDSNTAVWGAAIAGGGANHVLAYYNGTAWTVAGK